MNKLWLRSQAFKTPDSHILNFKKCLTIFTILFLAILFAIPKGYYLIPPANKMSLTTKDPATQSFIPNSIGVYVINLDRSKERYTTILPLIERLNLPFKRLSAVDGKLLNDQERHMHVNLPQYIKIMGAPPKIGTIGCSLSHIQAWKTFLQGAYEFALILEDDVFFDPEILKNNLAFLLENKTRFDVVNLESFHHGFPITIKTSKDGHRLSSYLFNITHAGAYLLNRHAAEKYVQRALPIIMPIDHYFTRGWEFGLRFLGLEPRIVKQSGVESHIETSDRIQKSIGVFSFERPWIMVQGYVIRFVYGLYQFLMAF